MLTAAFLCLCARNRDLDCAVSRSLHRFAAAAGPDVVQELGVHHGLPRVELLHAGHGQRGRHWESVAQETRRPSCIAQRAGAAHAEKRYVLWPMLSQHSSTRTTRGGCF